MILRAIYLTASFVTRDICQMHQSWLWRASRKGGCNRRTHWRVLSRVYFRLFKRHCSFSFPCGPSHRALIFPIAFGPLRIGRASGEEAFLHVGKVQQLNRV